MTRHLTRIREDVARNIVNRTEQKIAHGGSSSVGWRDHLALGAFRYELGADRDAIRAAFAVAVEMGLKAYENAMEPGPRSRRTPIDWERLLGAIAALGDHEQRARAALVPRKAWYWPEDPFFKVRAEGCMLIQSALEGSPDQHLAGAVIDAARAENADREAVEHATPLARGVIAIAERSGAPLSGAISSMAGYHQHLARHGRLQFDNAGIIALVPLGLARLGIEAGIHVAVESEYVPLALL